MSKSADTVNTTEQKKRKPRVSSLEKAQNALKDLIEKRDALNKQIEALQTKCAAIIINSDPDLRARAYGTPERK